jgi:hypothetical protein
MARAERLLFHTLSFTLRPEQYLEIGTLNCGSALLVAAALDSLNSSSRMIWSIPGYKLRLSTGSAWLTA